MKLVKLVQAAQSFRIAVIAVLVLGSLVILSFAACWNALQVSVAVQQQVVEYGRLYQVRQTLLLLDEAETSQRGYVLTGNAEFLRPYNSARIKIVDELKTLKSLTSDQPPAIKAQYNQLIILANKRMTKAKQVIEIRRAQGFTPAQQIVASGEGRIIMDNARATVGKIEAYQQARIQERIKTASRSTTSAIVLGFLISITGLVIAPIGFRFGVKVLAEERRLIEELSRSNRNLQRLHREGEEFNRVVSHDLQAPIRSIALYISRAMPAMPEDFQKTKEFVYVQRALDSAQRMKVLLDELMVLFGIKAGESQHQLIQLDLALGAALENLAERIAKTRCRILRPEPLPLVRGNQSQLTQVFQNLIGNAIKFQSPGTIPVIEIRARLVMQEDQKFWAISITDNGIGFDPDYGEQIFQPFKRLHPASEYEGSGVGLAVCRKVVELHGGSIWAFPRIDSPGSVFTFSIPGSGPTSCKLPAPEV